MLKLYSGDLSPYSAKVRMQMYAKGIADIALMMNNMFMLSGQTRKSTRTKGTRDRLAG